jgi:RNA recognition motif-containing protein
MLKKIFVGCMPFGFSEDDIRREFEPYGKVQSIRLFQDLEHATFDAYAHVTIDTDNDDRLLNELDGKVIGNRLLRVNIAVNREDSLRRLEERKQTSSPQQTRRLA